ncbi:T9SS type A sorting domain-containing protein [Bizionia sediminis]|uniref:T9SS type A sorting domain-containing protein n=1 Tax=Bizionia sediminis TaxID=1737064 RepID=A0ABW5KSZ2_9FLAO
MKPLVTFLLLFGMFYNGMCQTFPFEREWGTYTGNTAYVRGHAMDSEGNIYSVGFVTDTDVFPATAASHQSNYGGGQGDGFIIKHSPEGDNLWATYFGGEDFDVIEGIAIDSNDHVVVVGITYSATGIATPGAFQEQPTDRGGGAFIAKFAADGSQLWGTHFYNASTRPDDQEPYNFHQDFVNPQYITAGVAINNETNTIFMFSGDCTHCSSSDNIATPGAFQPDMLGNSSYISAFSSSGNREWTSYYGINSSKIKAIAADYKGVYVVGARIDYPTSPYVPNTYFDSFDTYEFSYANSNDVYVSRFSFDGSTRLWSRIVGSSGVEFVGMSTLALDNTGLYIAGLSAGSTGGDTSGLATPGAYKETNGCGDGFLAKINYSGEIDWATYTLDWVEEAYENTTISCGSSVSNVSRIKSVFSAKDGVYFTGQTSMYVDIATEGAFMETLYGNTLYGQKDAFIMKFSTEGEREWGTFFGGEENETIPWVFPFQDAFYILGRTSSAENIDTLGSELLVGTQGYINKFSPSNLSVPEEVFSPFSIYPNPANTVLQISATSNMQSHQISFKMYNMLGQEVLTTMLKPFATNQEVDVSGLSSGLYVISLSYNNQLFTDKIIIE